LSKITTELHMKLVNAMPNGLKVHTMSIKLQPANATKFAKAVTSTKRQGIVEDFKPKATKSATEPAKTTPTLP
jgi:phosphoribosylcarboxyaminoimidazole (NCAIR) mutase